MRKMRYRFGALLLAGLVAFNGIPLETMATENVANAVTEIMEEAAVGVTNEANTVSEGNMQEQETVSEGNVGIVTFRYEEYFEEQDVKVMLAAEEGVVPEGAYVEIEPLENAELEAITPVLQQSVESNIEEKQQAAALDETRTIFDMYYNLQADVETTYAFDFHIYYTNEMGQKCLFEPANDQTINVSFEIAGLGVVLADEMQGVDLHHITDKAASDEPNLYGSDGEENWSDSEILTEKMTLTGDSISFDAEHFSVYAVTISLYTANADSVVVAAQEKAWKLINDYADPACFLEDPYRDEMTEAQYAELKQAALDATANCQTQFEKIEAITKMVSERIYYDYVYYNDRSQTLYINPYDVYTQKRTVCSGYARLMRTLFVSIGIPCMNIRGYDHEYNAVYDSTNDKWIFADATWCSRNRYTTSGTWNYGGYTNSRFNLTPESIAELSNHEVYGVSSLLYGDVYYDMDDVGDVWSSMNWELEVSGAKSGVTTIKSVSGFEGFYVSRIDKYNFWNNNVLEVIDLSATKIATIENFTFYNAGALKNVIMPSTLTAIGDNAFVGCEALQTIDLKGTQVATIGDYAMYHCSSLQAVTLPSTLTTIGDKVFWGCDNLQTIDLKGTQVASIGDYAMYHCSSLQAVTLPSTLNTIGDNAFGWCEALQAIDLKGTQVTSIGDYAIYKCSALKTATLPSTLNTIGDRAFGGCEALKAIDLSETQVTSIESGTFYYCTELESVLFPNSLKSIGESAFYGCTSLQAIDLGATQLEAIGKEGFYYCQDMNMIYLPSTLKIIGENAFGGCFYLETFVITPLSEEQLINEENYQWRGRHLIVTPYIYTIQFDGNGATSGSTVNMTCGKDVECCLNENGFERKGYTFAGWNTQANGKGTTYANEAEVKNLTSKANDVVTLYAKWTPNKYTIKFSGNGATSGSMSSLKNRKYGTSYKLTANKYKRTGYTFVGWNTKKNGTGKLYKNKASIKNLTASNGKTVTLYAQWKPKTYKIKYYLNGGKNSSKNPVKYTPDTKTITLKKPTRKGYVFKGWYSDKKLTKKVTKIKKGSTGTKTLYAKWVKK